MKRYLPEKQVAARYDVHVVSLARWDKDPKLGFPPPIRIRGRKYRDQDELDAFDASRRECRAFVAERIAERDKRGGENG